jgi:hypothetical protein
MKKTLIQFVVNSILNNPNNFQLGEEVRALRETIEDLMVKEPDDVIGVILILMYLFPNDYDLGQHVRGHLINFKLYLENVETNIN